MPHHSHPNKRWTKASSTAANTSRHKWVRPGSSAKNASNTSASPTPPHRKQPILKDPAVPKRSWKRSHPDKSNHHHESHHHPNRTWTRVGTASTTTTAETETPIEPEALPDKVGQEDGFAKSDKTPLVDNHNNGQRKQDENRSSNTTNQWTKIGKHKLVHTSAKEPNPSTENGSSTTRSVVGDQPKQPSSPPTHSSNNNNNDTLHKVGHHKLVATKASRSLQDEDEDSKNQTKQKKRSKEPRSQDLHHAKRIRIAAAPNPRHNENESARDETATATNNGKPQPESDTQLTTFAYCQPTASTNTAAGAKHWRGSRSHKANRRNVHSLVRVPTNDATRICPAFARGRICENEDCLLRHDVPPEAAQPTCFYFSQQQGMCLKEDCPFRHVKSSSNKTPCPRFVQTGYCTQENCPLAHIQHKNKTLRVSAATASSLKKEKDLVFYDD